MSDLLTVRTEELQDVCELIIDCPHSTPKWTNSGYIVIRNQNIRNGRLNLEKKYYTDLKNFEHRTRRAKPRENDIVFTREAPMGEVCIIPKALEACVGQRQVLLRVKKTINPIYIFYALQSPFVKHQILWNEGTGSTVSNVRIPVLKKLNIPRLNHEDEIASILSEIDRKIELNRQINETLEEMVQAIFKSWFVDFDPTRAKVAALESGGSAEDAERAAMRAISGKSDEELSEFEANAQDAFNSLKSTAALFPSALQDSELGEIPEGWVVKSANEMFAINIGKTPPRKEAEWFTKKNHGVKWVSIRDMGESDAFINMTKEELTRRAIEKFNIKTVGAGTVLLSFKLTVGRVCIVTEEMTSNEAIAHFGIDENSELKTFQTYCYLQAFNYQSLGSTSSIATAVNSKIIKAMPIISGGGALNTQFEEMVTPLFESMSNIQKNSQDLSQLRDTLLPKLLSGEIDLSNFASADVEVT